MMKSLMTAAFAAFVLAGCASVPMGDPAQDAVAKQFRAPTDKAGLYVYRNETFGAAIKMTVLVDGNRVGETASKTYFYQELPPGKHTITSISEVNDTLDVDLKPGMLAYVWQEVKMGLASARSKLHLVDESEGRKGVGESKLATK